MRTMLVNPYVTTKRVPAGQYASGSLARAPNPPRRRRRRSNPSMPLAMSMGMPMVLPNPRRRTRHVRRANPLVLPNRRRARRRRNDGIMGATKRAFSLDSFLKTAATGAVTGGAVYLVNKLLIAKVGVDENGLDTQNGFWLRQLLRLGVGAFAAAYWPGAIGASINGAMSYPFASEMDGWWGRQGNVGGVPGAGAGPVSAALEADLNDVLNELY